MIDSENDTQIIEHDCDGYYYFFCCILRWILHDWIYFHVWTQVSYKLEASHFNRSPWTDYLVNPNPFTGRVIPCGSRVLWQTGYPLWWWITPLAQIRCLKPVITLTDTALLCKAKRQYLLTCKVSRYCLLALPDRAPVHNLVVTQNTSIFFISQRQLSWMTDSFLCGGPMYPYVGPLLNSRLMLDVYQFIRALSRHGTLNTFCLNLLTLGQRRRGSTNNKITSIQCLALACFWHSSAPLRSS